MPRSHTLSKHAEDASKAQKRNSRRTSYTGAEGERDYTQRHPITRKSSTRDETRKSVNRKDSGCRCTLALSSTIPTPSPPSTPTSSTVTPILAQLPPSLEQDVEADIIQTHTQNYSAHTQNRNHNTHTHNLNHNTHACSQDYGGDVSTQKHSTHAPMTTHTQQYTRSSAQIRTESCVSSHTDGVGSNTNNVVEATVEDAAHAGSTARVNTSIQRKHLSRTLEYNHERELFMKIRLLHMWASQDVRYFMQNIGTCVHDGHLIAHRCHECVTLYLTYRKILSMPFFERNENAARSVVVNCFLGFADACGSTCVTSKARQRLMKRVDNGISGCLARVVRTSAEVEYTESLRNWYSIVHTQTDASPLHAHVAKTHPTLHQRHKHHGSHKGRHEDEHGYRRRIFFDLLDIVTLDLSETGASGLIGILYQSGGDVDKLPPLYLAIVKSMRQTVADSFYNLRCERERSKAQRRDSKAEAVLAHPDYTDILVPIASRLEIPLIPLANHINQWRDGGHKADATVQTTRPAAKNALIVYTSGTTGKPKGVLLSHGNVDHQIRGLVEAWHWQPTDHLLHVLPLHHVHGIVVALLGALYSGAICEFHPVFCETSVLSRLSGMAPAHFGKRRSGLQMGYLSHNDEKSENVSKQTKISSPNMFMAVPTIYAKLLQRHRALLANEADVSAELHDKLKQNLRLMTSGSAPLPISVMDEWRRVSGHTLLERYGMTETGICISNSYEGERVPAAVGKPMLGVEARIANVDNLEVVQDIADGESGILLIRGAGVFREYWGNVRATAESFVDGQWFVTGDEAVREPNGVIRILGRASSDILKTGGYKVSALEVENVLLEHPEVNECVVYGTPDEVWGDRITAMVVQHNPKPELMIEDLRTFAKCRLADYKLPSRLVLKETIPRNAMGKVNKKALVKDKANW
ncbi:hypothetical protein SARC_02070 [Sphaeroforma arctica JP610]|uniref:AMP-dependent synthetase/ligase domain-containing protein n=1 Tax=Sphaeroforma arctica JP610 TaxID=667725 RepID=A0A0L0GA58_9EUKA|nr:hypothetical protein SARC_02070 [Sphaeroforma arctica JP610]KNC85766.1 hypothetical protein SARC_02070 [Sphaeroforma arctica JP610]|eukprot:XP_014159668.1 hypothetical protein SARC_02070 [Sphaeroforma arctica JP610]